MKSSRLGLAARAGALVVLLLVLSPSARGHPPLPLVRRAALDPAAQNTLLQFTSHGHVLGFRTGEFYTSNGTYALRVEFPDANSIAPASDTPSASNTDTAPPLSRVTYANLWEGITLAYDAARGGVVSSSYRLEPHADPRAIHLRYNAHVTLNAHGTLTIAYAAGEMVESAPLAWQEVGGGRVPVRAAFVLRGEREVGFAVGEYDAAQQLFIDPTLAWNTFLGGSGFDYGHAIAVDGSGDVYVAGISDATWGSPIRAFTSVYDAFAAKLDSNGNLTWNTFLGGSGTDYGNAVAVDGSGNVYVAGYSAATWGAPVRAFTGGLYDAFAAKLDSNGNLTWNTFLGGSGYDNGSAIAVDGSGNVYAAGYSAATWGSPVRAFTSATLDAFAAKLDSNGNLTWNTFLGGSGVDSGDAITVDQSGDVYVAGLSDATWGSPIRAFTSGNDAFAAKLDSNGNLTWNTFLGGSAFDHGYGIAVDGSGNVYVAGSSAASWGSPIRAFRSGNDAFAAKLDSNGNLTWNTFLGGSGTDYGYAIAVDESRDVYVAGFSDATWGSPIRAFTGGLYDAFAAKLDSNGNLTWNTFLGGSGTDYGNAVAVDASRNIYVTGSSTSTWGESVRAFTSGADAFVAKIYGVSLYLPLISK